MIAVAPPSHSSKSSVSSIVLINQQRKTSYWVNNNNCIEIEKEKKNLLSAQYKKRWKFSISTTFIKLFGMHQMPGNQYYCSKFRTFAQYFNVVRSIKYNILGKLEILLLKSETNKQCGGQSKHCIIIIITKVRSSETWPIMMNRHTFYLSWYALEKKCIKYG